ncbi:MAG: carbonic anhydrase [Clostridiales bacterium]|nr:carbonic anhydrase [Clostridiales bacterium]
MKNNCKTASEALQCLKNGNKSYLTSSNAVGNTSPEKRLETVEKGQHPFAVIVSCADSRVIPESIFYAGIGDLFVIRGAGNVIDNTQLGSVEYAVDHLGCKLVLVLGHTGCGAVGAAMHENSGHVKCITDEIKRAIGNECDEVKASILNVKHSVTKIKENIHADGLVVIGALYHTDSGKVDFEI